MNPLYLRAVAHIVRLGFTQVEAESIASMDLDSECEYESHWESILECNASDITAWIGIEPTGGVA